MAGRTGRGSASPESFERELGPLVRDENGRGI